MALSIRLIAHLFMFIYVPVQSRAFLPVKVIISNLSLSSCIFIDLRVPVANRAEKHLLLCRGCGCIALATGA